MPHTIEQAIEALRNLSPTRQEEFAGYICHLAADEREPEEIDPRALARRAGGARTTEARPTRGTR